MRCLDVLSALFLHVANADAILLLFDSLVELEASTRFKAGSQHPVKAQLDAKVKHFVTEVSQFHGRSSVPKRCAKGGVDE